MMPMTTWVRRLLIANVVMFLVTASSPLLYRALMFFPPLVLRQPWTAVTYMFLHAGIGHLFFNMIGLYFFGPRLEERLGGRDFLWLYFLSGICGAVLSVFFARNAPIVGASGGVYGVLLAFAMIWPRERIYLWAILPVEAWLLASLLVFGSLYSGITGTGSGTAHFAHLGGLVFAFAFLKWSDYRRGSGKRTFQKKLSQTPQGGTSERATVRRWAAIDIDSLHELNREEVVSLLERVRAQGAASLSKDERSFLDRMVASREPR